MQKIPTALAVAVLSAITGVKAASAGDVSATEKLAAFADFSAKLDALEQAVDEIRVAGALALLTHEYPAWEFDRSSSFDSVITGSTNDLGVVAASHEYAMGKSRGAIVRNKHVSDEQRELALQLLAQVKDLILEGYELEKHVETGDMATAGQHYREVILNQSDRINDDIDQLTKEIEQTIKFSAL